MNMNEYQKAAARFINTKLNKGQKTLHALHLISAECGEVHGIYQKYYQGHKFDVTHLQKEIGDVLWGLAELCTAYGWNLDDVAAMNIEKLSARYPNGFDTEKSLHRKEGDV